jgi:transposase InsO family protein
MLVAEVFADSHETYGYRRVHAALLRRGEHCSAELVRALMRTTVSKAQRRAHDLREELKRRGVHADVLRFCRAELMQQNYFHAVPHRRLHAASMCP